MAWHWLWPTSSVIMRVQILQARAIRNSQMIRNVKVLHNERPCTTKAHADYCEMTEDGVSIINRNQLGKSILLWRDRPTVKTPFSLLSPHPGSATTKTHTHTKSSAQWQCTQTVESKDKRLRYKHHIHINQHHLRPWPTARLSTLSHLSCQQHFD